MKIRVGFGYDIHKLQEGRALWMGGVQIDHPKGLLGHSDADVLLHAISDAILGAANMRDIGFHFPDTDPKFKGADSKMLLSEIYGLIAKKGYIVSNIDASICAEVPKMNPHIPAMQEMIAGLLHIDQDEVSIKATTSEKMGFVGREEGIKCYAVVLIQKDA